MPARKTPTAPAAPTKAVRATQAVKAMKTTKPAAAAPKPAARAPVKAEAPTPKAEKPRDKLVRDSFTMPQVDFALIDLLKQRALGFKRPTKKSELLRAGLQALAALPPAALKTALGQLVPLKTGRPKKGG